MESNKIGAFKGLTEVDFKKCIKKGKIKNVTRFDVFRSQFSFFQHIVKRKNEFFFLVSDHWHEKFDPKVKSGPYNAKIRVFRPLKIVLFSMAEKHVFWHFTEHYSLLNRTFDPNN